MGRGGRQPWDEPDAHPVPVLKAELLLSELVAREVEFVIIGGFCLFAHGVIRATKDVDIVPAPDEANLYRLQFALADLEAKLLFADDFGPHELGIDLDVEGLSLGGNWVLSTRFGRLDVMQAVDGVRSYADLRARAVSVVVPDVGPCLFASIDDLIAMKTAAGRPQDQIDVASLERARSQG